MPFIEAQDNIFNRDAFLENIATKLGRSVSVSSVNKPKLRHTCHKEVMSDLTQDELTKRFIDYVKESLGSAAILLDKNEVEPFLKNHCHRYCEQSNPTTGDVVLSARSDLLAIVEPNEIDSAHCSTYIWDKAQGYQANIDVAERAKIGIVMAEYALTESGTMVLFSDSDQGRAISLLPESSIFIVAKSRLLPRMTQMTEILHKKAAQGERVPSCVNFISGPSSTADIELIKVVGVHGPVAATYIIIDDM